MTTQRQITNLKTLQSDDVFPVTTIVPFESVTNMPSRKGLEQAVIANGKIVNVVSNQYGLLKNEDFFLVVEEKLIEADITYDTRSINRKDESFAVDYILNDPNYHINVKQSKDIIKPMLRFTNSYDGSCKTSGNFGFFREICLNGNHVSKTTIGFNIKHRGNVAEIVVPEINVLLEKFMNNEFYSLHRKFEVLAETKVEDLEGMVKYIADKSKLFNFETSAKNPTPSVKARRIIEIVNQEAAALGSTPNLWLGYNAFNSVLHNEIKQGFSRQRNKDIEIFDLVVEMAN